MKFTGLVCPDPHDTQVLFRGSICTQTWICAWKIFLESVIENGKHVIPDMNFTLVNLVPNFCGSYEIFLKFLTTATFDMFTENFICLPDYFEGHVPTVFGNLELKFTISVCGDASGPAHHFQHHHSPDAGSNFSDVYLPVF